jgi:hypothetical protein
MIRTVSSCRFSAFDFLTFAHRYGSLEQRGLWDLSEYFVYTRIGLKLDKFRDDGSVFDLGDTDKVAALVVADQ